jgi:hypothetical protein
MGRIVLETNQTDLERLMREGQTAAKRGDKATARTLLTQLLELDSNNEQAWMWLSGVVAEVEEQTTCLENVLTLNPANEAARSDRRSSGQRAASGELCARNASWHGASHSCATGNAWSRQGRSNCARSPCRRSNNGSAQ